MEALELSDEHGSVRPRPAGGPEASGGHSQQLIDSAALLGAFRSGGAWLDAHVAEINALNVFPVPDGDTGTNMTLTMKAAVQEVGDRAYASAAELARVLAHGALMGARGNSGVILSQILRGFARSLDARECINAQDLAAALQESCVTAYKGVMQPVEGTILTVVREAAQAARQAAEAGAGIEQVLEFTVSEAKASVARTPKLLPVLAAAGVVDAGGHGLAIVLEGMWRYFRGETVESTQSEAHVPMVHAPEGGYNYDTQFIVQGEALNVDDIRRMIASMGDSVLVVGDERAIKVHVHSDHPGEVLEYGLTQGQVSDVIVENMQLQYEAFVAAQRETGLVQAAAAAKPLDIGLVAVVSGEGLRRVFESLGVNAIVSGGQTMNPSTQDLLQAVNAIRSDKVIILPNNSNIVLAAEQAKGLAEKQVAVVPTKTVPQGIAALLAFNYQGDLESNVEAMTECCQQVQTIEVTRAVRSAQMNGLSIEEGQFIGLLNDDLQTVAQDAPAVVQQLLERIGVDKYEIVTVYYGQGVSAHEAEAMVASIRALYPHLEIEVLSGGQPHYHYVISAE